MAFVHEMAAATITQGYRARGSVFCWLRHHTHISQKSYVNYEWKVCKVKYNLMHISLKKVHALIVISDSAEREGESL